MTAEPFGLTSPCRDCPFRTDVRPYLTPERILEIRAGLVRSTFPCHKTTQFDDEGEHAPSDNEMHCAGALILKEKLGEASQMMQIGERLGLYNASKLNMDAPVFDTFEEMARVQPKPKRSCRKKK